MSDIVFYEVRVCTSLQILFSGKKIIHLIGKDIVKVYGYNRSTVVTYRMFIVNIFLNIGT